MNLVSLIMQFLGPAIVGKLASSLGINSTIAQKVIAAAVPAILAGLAGKASQPSGAGALFDILGKQDPGMLGKLAGVIGGAQQKEIAQQGSNVLGSLLGNNAIGALTGAVGKFAGIGEAPAQGMLGMLAPVVLGTLGQQAKSSNLDAGGIAKLLAGQKDNIASSLPGDFSKLLGGSGLLDALSPPAATASASKPAQSAVPHTAAPVTQPMRPAPVRAGSFNWWPWLIAIALAGAGWWYWFAGRPQVAAIPQVPRIMAGTNDLGGQLETSLKGLQGLLASVKDAPSAQTALPRLRETQAALDRISGTSGLSPDAKKSMAGYVASWLPALTPLITGLLGNTAVAPVLKPVLDTLRTRLEAMAKA